MSTNLVPIAESIAELGAFPAGHWLRGASIDVDLQTFENRHEKISLIVPTRNEAEGLRFLLPHLKGYYDELIIVDGHSTDGTREIAEATEAEFYLDGKRGKGDAIRLAIEKAKHPILVFIDADLSHDPSDIPKLVVPILKGNADHVIASRPRGGSDELHGDFEKFFRMIGSDIITLGINYRFDVRLSDSQNGFRAIRADLARKLDLREDITTIEQEMTIKSLALGCRIQEIPSHEYARVFGESKIRLANVSFRYVYSWLKYLFLARKGT